MLLGCERAIRIVVVAVVSLPVPRPWNFAPESRIRRGIHRKNVEQGSIYSHCTIPTSYNPSHHPRTLATVPPQTTRTIIQSSPPRVRATHRKSWPSSPIPPGSTQVKVKVKVRQLSANIRDLNLNCRPCRCNSSSISRNSNSLDSNHNSDRLVLCGRLTR
jgi:hypothetical protein